MWWDSLTSLQQIMFIIATSATAIMIIMIIMMLLGMDNGDAFDGDVDMDFDMDGDIDGTDIFNNDSIISISGLKIVSIRGILAFFSIGGWVTYGLAATAKPWVAILIGALVGCIAAVIVAVVMRLIMKLESSGNLDYRTAVGKTAVVYIRIPKSNSGKGKVMFTHQGRLVEVDAITKQDQDIIAKHEVVIIGVENETTLVVKTIEEDK